MRKPNSEIYKITINSKLPTSGTLKSNTKKLWSTGYHEYGVLNVVIPKRRRINLNPSLFQRFISNIFDSEFRLWIIFFLSLLIFGIIRIIVS